MAERDADRLVVAFARLARRLGLEVPVGATVTLGQAWAAVGLGARDACYWAGRVVLLRRPEDAPLYDRAFGAFWEGRGASAAGPTCAGRSDGPFGPTASRSAGRSRSRATARGRSCSCAT